MNVKQEIERRTSNTHKILQLFKEKGWATNAQLLKIGGYRYSARIFELRREGHIIVPVHIKDGLWDYIYKGQKPDFEPDEDDEPPVREVPDIL